MRPEFIPIRCCASCVHWLPEIPDPDSPGVDQGGWCEHPNPKGLSNFAGYRATSAIGLHTEKTTSCSGYGANYGKK